MFGYTGAYLGQMPPPPPGVSCVDIALGSGHGLLLLSDGQVMAWGDNSHGECNVPALPPGTSYIAIAAESGHSHAARSDGTILSWGQVWGLPIPPSETLWTLPPGVTCTQMAAGQFQMIALLSTGKVMTWGTGPFFEGYVPSLEELQGGSSVPLRFTDASINLEAAMAVVSDGRLVGWGNVELPPASVTAGRTFTKVRYGVWHHAAMTDSGEVLAWGDNSYGKATIPPLPPGVTYTDFECSAQNTVLVRSDGQAIVVGATSQGQANVPALPPGVTYVACDANEEKTVLLRSDGQVVSFGQATWPSQNLVPALPAGLVYTEIAASKFFNTAIRSDGSAVMFGSLGSAPPWRSLPTLPFGVYFVEADGGEFEVVLRRSDGRVEVCGNVYLTGNVPPQLDPGTSFLQVSGGYDGAVMGRTGAESTYVGIAPGCVGSLPSTRLVPRDTPKIGRRLEVTLFDLPVDIAMLVMSFQQLAQPVSLAFLGMPGCDMHIPIDAVALLSGQNHQAKWILPVPDQPLLLGVEFYNQALVLDPQAGNGFGAVVSDVARGVVGDR